MYTAKSTPDDHDFARFAYLSAWPCGHEGQTLICFHIVNSVVYQNQFLTNSLRENTVITYYLVYCYIC